MHTLYNKFSSVTAILFFILLGGIGLWMLPDYGVTWDEVPQRNYGLASHDYVVKTLRLNLPLYYDNIDLNKMPGRQYTVFFSTVAAFIENIADIDREDFRSQFLLRHYMVFTLYYLSLLAFYGILMNRFKNRWTALIGTLLLVLSPRIFGHSFFNPKDIVLLSFYVIGIYTLTQFLKKKNIKWAFIHGIACALAFNARQPGMLLALGSIIMIILDYLHRGSTQRNIRKTTLHLGIMTISFMALSVLLFPYAWTNPVDKISHSSNMMAKFPWDGFVLFGGDYIHASQLPWYYIYSWIGISTPVFNLIVIISGFIFFGYRAVKQLKKLRLWSDDGLMYDWAFFGFAIGPLLAIHILGSTIYDGWRQVFFVYPPMLLLGMAVWHKIFTYNKHWKKIALTSTLLACSIISYKMMKIHPLEPSYFNVLAKKPAWKNYEMDYWGQSFFHAMKLITEKDQREEVIHLSCHCQPCIDNYYFLPEAYRNRLKMRFGIEVSHYYLTNFRFPEEMKKYEQGVYPFEHEFFTLKQGEEKVIGVYRIRE